MYQLVLISPFSMTGDPIQIPEDFIGLTDAVLADLSATMSPAPIGYEGKGLWPLVMSTPAYDRATETATGEIDLASRKPDKATRTVPVVYGKRPLAADEIAALNPVPDSVSSAQACAILDDDGMLDRVEAIVAGMPRTVQIWFARANDWHRASPYVAGIGLELDLSDDTLDEMFRRAARRV